MSNTKAQKRLSRSLFIILVFTACAGGVFAQDKPAAKNQGSAGTQQPANADNDPAPKRIFGVIPNYRTTADRNNYVPITTKQKIKLATQDSFDPGTFILAALFAGESQLTKSTPSFGNGPAGYAKYYAASYSDFVIGNYMTEAVYPAIFHQDPRYFRRASGSALSRLGYAVGQTFWTHNDSGRKQFNFSEVLGNSTSVAISNAYYADNRNAGDSAMRLGIQIGVDVVGNILKEFSPELNQLFSRKHSTQESSNK